MRGIKFALLVLFTVILVALLAVLHSSAKETTFIFALDEILFGLLTRIWEFLRQPIVFAAVAVCILLRLGGFSIRDVLGILGTLSAKIGPVSVTTDLDTSRLLGERESEEAAPSELHEQPAAGAVEKVVSTLEPKIAEVLVDLANKTMTHDEVANLVSHRLAGKEAVHEQTNVYWAFGMALLRSFGGILLRHSVDEVDGETRYSITMSRLVLGLLYERIKQHRLKSARD